MKKNALFLLILVLLGGVSFWSCDDNDDDYIYQSIVTVKLTQSTNGDSFYLLTAKDNKLTPVNQNEWITSSLTNGMRALATYKIESGTSPDYSIKLYRLSPILTKPVWEMTVENADTAVTAKKAPGVIRDLWYDGTYLNVIYNTYFVDATIYVNMFKNSTQITTSTQNGVTIVDTIPSTTPNPTNGTLTLQFNVNLNGNWFVPPMITSGMASFTIPATIADMSKVTSISVLYYDFNMVQQTQTINLSSSTSTLYKTDLSTEKDVMNKVQVVE